MAIFRTRARTLDMLGRQQIAGIPTAISELFKNAHDAYADRVEVDYYRKDGLFVLRDDGMGMTEEEFRDRWLTIGTESKLDKAGMGLPPTDPEKSQRPILGEKGIGRLAIATIGPQVLVLTRAKHGRGASDVVAAFVHWGLFECPGVNLEDIQVPVRTFPKGELPSGGDVGEMVEEYAGNAERLREVIGEEYHSRICEELRQFSVDPQEIDAYLGAPSLRGNGGGTHFIILPTSELLPLDIDGEPGEERATPLTKALLGFTNTMTSDHNPPAIEAAFRDHKTDEYADDLIGAGEFFRPEEFLNADHHVIGRFDEFGQFVGRVSVYGEPVEGHTIPWPRARGNRTRCGPFSMSFATVQGAGRESTLPPDDHARMVQKMNKIGGIYIYRDGVRVLPYGDTDYDWLDIELNRTKGASYYYFSYRRIFGAIELSGGENPELSEKAGREGFRENRAYRQFKSILKNFLVQVAADFFRKEGVRSDRFEQRRAELEKAELDRRRRERAVSVRRAKLGEDLEGFFTAVGAQEPQRESLELVEEVSEELRRALEVQDPQEAAQAVLRVEQGARSRLQELEARFTVKRPRIALGKAMEKEWRDYESACTDLGDSVFHPTRELIEGMVGEKAGKARIRIDRRLRAEVALSELSGQAKRRTREGTKEARERAEEKADEVRGVARSCTEEVEAEVRAVMSEFQRMDVTALSDEEFVATRDMLESRIQQVGESKSALLDTILDQLEALDFSGEASVVDQLVAVEERNLQLEEAGEADLQLAQLGMAVEVVNHEFNATIRSLRNNLRRLKGWADINEDIRGLYTNIRASFDHLDGYLTLFTPLQRRLYRKAVKIRGADIHDFLTDLFEERFRRHHVTLVQTRAFAKIEISGFPSSFYPVFVNLVDNAVYWLSTQNPSKERRIELDARNEGFVVADSGPGVGARDRERMFELGFTRKPGGRGMGLHISREVLRRVGYELFLVESGGEGGATFAIRPQEQHEDGSDDVG